MDYNDGELPEEEEIPGEQPSNGLSNGKKGNNAPFVRGDGAKQLKGTDLNSSKKSASQDKNPSNKKETTNSNPQNEKPTKDNPQNEKPQDAITQKGYQPQSGNRNPFAKRNPNSSTQKRNLFSNPTTSKTRPNFLGKTIRNLGLSNRQTEQRSVMSEFGKKLVASTAKLIVTNPAAIVFIIAGVFIAFLFLIIIPAIAVSISDEDGEVSSEVTELSTGVSYTVNNTKMWWPIGSNETTNIGGRTFATGTPACTTYVNDYDSGGEAIDIQCGTVNVIAAMDGVVEKVVDYCKPWDMVGGESTGEQASCGGKPGGQRGYGNNVVIDHGNGIKTRYAHLASVNVKAGEKVYQGQVIGIEGNTGHVSGRTGIHLHFEVLINEKRVIPSQGYVSASDTRPMSENAYLSSSKTKTKVKGSTNEQTVCLYLKESGFSDAAVAGIMGNIENESGFNPAAVNYIDCRGLVQWCYGRKISLMNVYGTSWSNMNNQLAYIVYEITEGGETAALKYLNASYSASEMAEKFCYGYERPEAGVCSSGKRQASAANYYSYVQNGCN